MEKYLVKTLFLALTLVKLSIKRIAYLDWQNVSVLKEKFETCLKTYL